MPIAVYCQGHKIGVIGSTEDNRRKLRLYYNGSMVGPSRFDVTSLRREGEMLADAVERERNAKLRKTSSLEKPAVAQRRAPRPGSHR